MIEQDTVKLLRECNAGIKMGVQSIDDLLPKAEDDRLKDTLSQSKQEHEKLGNCSMNFMMKGKSRIRLLKECPG